MMKDPLAAHLSILNILSCRPKGLSKPNHAIECSLSRKEKTMCDYINYVALVFVKQYLFGRGPHGFLCLPINP